MILLIYCWIHFVNILLKILTFMYIRDCCCSSVSKSCLTLCDPMIALFVPHRLEFTQVHVHWISDATQPSQPLSSLFTPAFNLSQHIRVFSNELALPIRWVKVLELQLQLRSVQWIFKVDYLWDWLVWSPCCPRNSQESSPTQQFKRSILWCSAFFMVQLSHLYLTIGKTILLTTQTFVGRVMSLLFTTLSKFVIAFLLRSKHLLISWLQSSSAVILELKKRKSVTASTFSPSICH